MENIEAIKYKRPYCNILYFDSGIILYLSNPTGNVIEETNYDPWGRTRDPNTWQYDNTAGLDIIYHGFTGHEHLPEFALINMNGRMYDPVLGRMLSPDNYVQDPYNPQNYNRYAYCLNNPLKYVDPSGYMFRREKEFVFVDWSSAYQTAERVSRGARDPDFYPYEYCGGFYYDNNGSIVPFEEVISNNSTRDNIIFNTSDPKAVSITPSGIWVNYFTGTLPERIGIPGDKDFRVFFSINIIEQFISFSTSSRGIGNNLKGYTTIAGLEMAGVGGGLKDYAGSSHQYKYGQQGSASKIHSNKVVTRASKIQAYKYARYAKTAGRAVGFLGAGITAWEGAMDGDFTWGDATQVGVALATIFTPYGWAYGLIDLGVGLISGQSVTDRIGTAIDEW